jgi:3',5'-cyclic AMP phosphodiesterase CpdA
MSRRTVYLVFFLLSGITLAYWSLALEKGPDNPDAPALVGGPMVQVGNSDGTTSLAIVWRTAEASTSRVDYGPSPALGLRVVDHRLTLYHAVVLRHLKPSSRYHYRVLSNNQILHQAVFQTGKNIGEPFRFAVFGDSGSGKAEQYELAGLVKQQQVDMIVHTGDVVYPKGEDKDYRAKFYLPYQSLLEQIPIFPAMGNHDYETHSGQPWVDNFFLPGAERFYSFDYSNAHFTALDSNRIDAASAHWLEQDLATTRKTWKFVFFHEPPFSNKDDRTGNAAARNLWLPLLEKYKVDIVFSGHDHLYTRFTARRGVLYIVEGLGGYSRYKINRDAAHVEATDNSQYGFGLVEVAGPNLTFRHVTAMGKVLDTLILTKGIPVASSVN